MANAQRNNEPNTSTSTINNDNPVTIGLNGTLLTRIEDLVIAGWAGRDRAAVEHHIRELEEIGVPRPAKTPTFYRVARALATTASTIEDVGNTASGEVEAIVIAIDGDVFVTVGSDHTDRALETVGVALSKQVCAKPVAPTMWRLADVIDHWDSLVLRSWATINGQEVDYQNGSVSANLSPIDLAELLAAENGRSSKTIEQGTMMFCGTLPVIGGVRPADAFRVELFDPILNRSLSHRYDCIHLKVAG